MVLSEMISYIKNEYEASEISPVFKLSDLKKLFCKRMEHYSHKPATVIHSTRLKDCILLNIPEMEEKEAGREVILAFKQDIGRALIEACSSIGQSPRINKGEFIAWFLTLVLNRRSSAVW